MLGSSVEAIVATMVAAVFGIFGWLFKRNHAKLEELDDRIVEALDEQEIRQIIDDKLEPLRTQHTEFIHRLSRLEIKIDQLLELMVHVDHGIRHDRHNK